MNLISFQDRSCGICNFAYPTPQWNCSALIVSLFSVSILMVIRENFAFTSVSFLRRQTDRFFGASSSVIPRRLGTLENIVPLGCGWGVCRDKRVHAGNSMPRKCQGLIRAINLESAPGKDRVASCKPSKMETVKVMARRKRQWSIRQFWTKQ